jgi:hypothetical protein
MSTKNTQQQNGAAHKFSQAGAHHQSIASSPTTHAQQFVHDTVKSEEHTRDPTSRPNEAPKAEVGAPLRNSTAHG